MEEHRTDASAPSEHSFLITQDPDVAASSAVATTASCDESFIQDESDMFPLRKLSYLLATWLAIFGSAVLKGGDGVQGFVQCGSNAYWTVVMLPATVAVPLTYSFGRELVLKSEQKKTIGYRTARGDIRWDKKCTILYPAICFACGIAAGALGIAAGMILSPILLELGMIPAVAAATSGFAVLFTSSCTRFHRIFFCFCAFDS